MMDSKNITMNDILTSRIANILNKPRVLDSRPKPFHLTPIGQTNTYGVADIFAQVYNLQYPRVDQTRACRVILTNTEAIVDIQPFVCLKTLLLMNINTNPELSKTCIILFKRIAAQSTEQDANGVIHITKDKFRSILLNISVSSVYAKALIKGMLICAYPDDYRTRVWYDIMGVDISRYNNLRVVGLQYIKNHPELEVESDIKKCLRSAYRDALKAKGFVKKFASDLSMEARGMAFLVFMNHPEIFVEHDNSKFTPKEE